MSVQHNAYCCKQVFNFEEQTQLLIVLHGIMACPYHNDEQDYNEAVDKFRDFEYPSCHGKTYLDHGGTTVVQCSPDDKLYPKTLITRYAADLVANLYGNPHSDSAPSSLSSQRIADVRLRVLDLFNASPEDFDVVFTANATAAVKLVMDSFRDLAATSVSITGDGPGHFWYGYHYDAHTSLVGVREVTKGQHTCFENDAQVERWLDGSWTPSALQHEKDSVGLLGLFAYPGQSNMTGRRLPLSWNGRLRRSQHGNHVYSLFDAAALSTTAPIDFSNADDAPDFTSVSFYKIFGFPDLGALIVRKQSGHILQWRRYFGGGTVDMVTVLREQWHENKDVATDPHYELHDRLEDGTLPFHDIVALGHALDVHMELFGSMKQISRHTQFLVKRLYDVVSDIQHDNGTPLCRIYTTGTFGDASTQGATLAFNVQCSDGSVIPYTQVERSADEQGIYLRSGGLCNPGGIATHLRLAPWEMKRSWSAGHRCGHATEIVSGKPTGVLRASLGAMSTKNDVDTLVAFMLETVLPMARSNGPQITGPSTTTRSILEATHNNTALQSMQSGRGEAAVLPARSADGHGEVPVQQTVARSPNQTTAKPDVAETWSWETLRGSSSIGHVRHSQQYALGDEPVTNNVSTTKKKHRWSANMGKVLRRSKT